MKATDSINHQTSTLGYKTQFDKSQTAIMMIKSCVISFRSGGYSSIGKPLNISKIKSMSPLSASKEPLEKPQITLPSNIKMLKVMCEDIISIELGIDPNNSVEVIEVSRKDINGEIDHQRPSFGKLEYLAGFIKNYMPNVKVLDFTKMSNTPTLSKDIIKILPQLDIIDLSGLQLKHEAKKGYTLFDYLFLAWRIIKDNLEGIITDQTKLTEAQKILKDADHIDIGPVLAKLPHELVQAVPEVIVGSRVLNQNMIKALDQLETIDLSGRTLDKSYDKLFLVWRMIKGNCAGITTDGSKLTDFQTFLKEYDDLLEGPNLTKKESDELKVKKILEKIEADYKSLFEFMEKTFQVGSFRNAIEKLDRNLTLIQADPNSFEFKKLPIDLNKQLVKAISILPAKDISFLISISLLSNTNIPISWFLSNTKIENTEITNLNNKPGKFAIFIKNTLLANVFDGNVKKPKSAAEKKLIELCTKVTKTGPFYQALQPFLNQENWLSCTEYLKKTLQKALKQQTQLEEVKQEFAGDNNTEYDPLEV